VFVTATDETTTAIGVNRDEVFGHWGTYLTDFKSIRFDNGELETHERR